MSGTELRKVQKQKFSSRRGGMHIKRLRGNIRQKELSEATGLTEQLISRLEVGSTQDPDFRSIALIAWAFDRTLDDMARMYGLEPPLLDERDRLRTLEGGAFLKEYREFLGYTQLRVRDDTGISIEELQRVESGYPNPNFFTLVRLAREYQLPLEQLVDAYGLSGALEPLKEEVERTNTVWTDAAPR